MAAAERAGGDFKDHFSRLARQYARYRPTYPAALFAYLAGISPGRQLAWDCACGGGQASVALAEHFDGVVATDASPQQVAAAVRHAQVSYRVAKAEDSGLQSGTVDLVTVAQALHWLDLPAFYAEVRRTLRPSGVLAVWTYGVLRVEAEDVNSLIRHFYATTVGPYWPPERQLVEDGYRSLAFPFAELTPPVFAMQTLWTRQQLLGYLRTWSATARYVDEVGVDPVEALGTQMDPLWKETDPARCISWPMALRIGRAPA
ncbi:MAG: class I SAM-dependent methyltransferase [Sinobacteraceae bacterium]|nr:class I SAM-dependent methyltransferase [Nevskiaceae bacterium]